MGRERIRVSENFFLDEFIDPHTYFTTRDKGRNQIDIRIISIAQKFRHHKGSGIVINNWWKALDQYPGEPLEFLRYCEKRKDIRCWSGLRTQYCSFGGPAHRYGYAIDMAGNQREYYNILKASPQAFYMWGVRRMEDPSITKGWGHIDTWERNTKPNSIRVVDLVKSTETITW